jgi:flagellar biosynthetic protein FliQ
MSTAEAVDLLRNAVLMTLLIVGPILVIGMVIGLLISLVQAVTQIQEQTLTFVPKIFAMAAALILVSPWMLTRLLEYTHQLFTTLP